MQIIDVILILEEVNIDKKRIINGQKLYLGDCLKVMKKLPDNSIDLIICDLPYGTTNYKWDILIPLDQLWEQYKRILKNRRAVVLTCSQPFTTDLINSNRKQFKYELIWKKNISTAFLDAKNKPLKIHENILVFSQGSLFKF